MTAIDRQFPCASLSGTARLTNRTLRLWLVISVTLPCSRLAPAADEPAVKRVTGIVTEYRHNSHADVILTRLLQTDTLDGQGRTPRLKLVSLYVDQFPKNDLSRAYARQYGFTLCESIPEALTLGTDQLAVEGVIIVAEHGSYPQSPTEQTVWPKRRFFSEVVQTFERTGRVVPVFNDKHLADNAADAVWLYETAQRHKIPLLAGSSAPGTWRKPPVDVPRDAELAELLVVSYGGLDAYGFHGLEFLQCLAERRRGGETGVESVRAVTGNDVWQAQRDGLFDRALLDAALPLAQPAGRTLVRPVEELVREPIVFQVRYRDGLKATLCHFNGAVAQWAASWRTRQGAVTAVRADLQEVRPFMHFAHLLDGIERMVHTGRPTWPVERTLFSSVMLHAGMTSRVQNGAVILTPELHRSYEALCNWKQPDERGR